MFDAVRDAKRTDVIGRFFGGSRPVLIDSRLRAEFLPEGWKPGTQVVGANSAVIPQDALLFQREPVS